MIPRYTLPEMGAIWSEATRFRLFVEVEVAVVRARARRHSSAASSARR